MANFAKSNKIFCNGSSFSKSAFAAIAADNETRNLQAMLFIIYSMVTTGSRVNMDYLIYHYISPTCFLDPYCG